MKKTFITIFASMATVLSTNAVATPDLDLNPGVLTRSGTEDVLMPSLAELLGDEIDSFGEYDVNAQLKQDLVGYASKYIGTRYIRGGKGPSGFDCSGFTSYVFREFGYTLSASSSAQGVQGESVDMDQLEVGDLMFFSGRNGGNTIGHVGMVVDVDRENGTCKFIHASTSQGVVIQHFPDGGYYSKRFTGARRVIETED